MLQYRLQPVENFRCDYATGADSQKRSRIPALSFGGSLSAARVEAREFNFRRPGGNRPS